MARWQEVSRDDIRVRYVIRGTSIGIPKWWEDRSRRSWIALRRFLTIVPHPEDREKFDKYLSR